MEYTFQQKIAIMRILLDIIHADGIIDERETFFFNMMKEKFNLTDEDHKLVNEKNSLIALSQIKQMNEEQKNEFARMMSSMIIVDEDINANEIAIYDVVTEFCDINISFEDTVSSERLESLSRS